MHLQDAEHEALWVQPLGESIRRADGCCHVATTTCKGASETGAACWAGKERIEMLLALGASRWEALHGTLQAGVLAAVMPVLDQMSVMGLIAMPGFMAGQLLGGVSGPQVCPWPRQCCVGLTISCLGSWSQPLHS